MLGSFRVRAVSCRFRKWSPEAYILTSILTNVFLWLPTNSFQRSLRISTFAEDYAVEKKCVKVFAGEYWQSKLSGKKLFNLIYLIFQNQSLRNQNILFLHYLQISTRVWSWQNLYGDPCQRVLKARLFRTMLLFWLTPTFKIIILRDYKLPFCHFCSSQHTVRSYGFLFAVLTEWPSLCPGFFVSLKFWNDWYQFRHIFDFPIRVSSWMLNWLFCLKVTL